MRNLSFRGMAVTMAVVFSVLMGSTLAWAVNEPANVIKYRKNLMKAVGAHITNIAAVLKGEVDFAGDIPANAAALVPLLKAAGHVFPEGTGEGDTDALPGIWEDRAKFDSLLEDTIAKSEVFAAAAESGDMARIGPAIGELGKACRACHDSFRKKKE